MTRQDEMILRYGECVTRAQAARIIGKSLTTVYRMVQDGRLRTACCGTMIDMYSVAEYITAPREIDHRTRLKREAAKLRFSV